MSNRALHLSGKTGSSQACVLKQYCNKQSLGFNRKVTSDRIMNTGEIDAEYI
jgi:hypothetical protein